MYVTEVNRSEVSLQRHQASDNIPIIPAKLDQNQRWAFIAIIYRRYVSAMIFLPIIVIAQNSFDLSITDIAFAIYFVIADKLSR